MKRIVIVEDDTLMRELLARTLNADGLDATECYPDALDALDALVSSPPDVVVSDVRMTHMSGLTLVRELRARGVATPVILVTADLTDTLVEEASALGVRHLVRKPFGDFAALRAAVRSEIDAGDTQETIERLDELRLALLTDLSHQLRTPLTAMQLALDGLFTQLHDAMNDPQRRLADIGRRNVNRVITLVENQLELLQMTMGEVTVSRRLVDVRQLLDGVAARIFDDDDALLERLLQPEAEGAPCYVFSDPSALGTIASCLLCGGPPSARRSLSLEYDADACHIDVRVFYLEGADAPVANSRRLANGSELSLVAPLSRLDFERRAYSAMMQQLGGAVEIERDTDHKHVRITLPVYPAYDRRKDFVNPVRALRRHAESRKLNVVILKCEFDSPGAETAMSDPVVSFLDRCRSILSDGDLLVRGRLPGSYYLALVDRSGGDVRHIQSYLGACRISDEDGNEIHVSSPQTIVDDSVEVDRLTCTLDPA